MPPQTVSQPPSSARQVLAQRRREFQARELSLLATLQDQFTEYFETFQEQLERYFQQFFVKPYPTIPGEPSWKLLQSAQLQTIPVLTAQFQAGLATVVEEAREALDQDLVDAYDEGYEEALWALFLAGEDEAIDAEDLDDDGILAALLVSGVDGRNYRDRLDTWAGLGLSSVDRVLRATIPTELPLTDTTAQYGSVTKQVAQGIASLASNELFLAMAAGAALAYGRFGEPEVWVTADDEKVCPICLPLHLTVTPLRPIIDTHPNCRCEKLPRSLVQGRQRTFIPYSRFQTRRP